MGFVGHITSNQYFAENLGNPFPKPYWLAQFADGCYFLSGNHFSILLEKDLIREIINSQY